MRRVLMLTSQYAAEGQVAAIRPRAWAEALAAAGWSVHVLVRDWRGADPDAGGGIDLHRLRVRSGPLTARLRRITGRLAVPDRTAGLWRRATAEAVAVAEEIAPDLVLSTSPPHAIHITGAAVAKAVGTPWVVDLRDPIIGDPRYGAVGARRLRAGAVAAFEQELVMGADAVVSAIPGDADRLRQRYPAAAGRIFLVTNGFPPHLAALADAHRPRPERRVVCCVGKIGDDELTRLASAVASLRSEGRTWRLVVLAKRTPAVDAAATLLGEDLVAPGLVPHHEALSTMAAADVLVSCLAEERSKVGGLSSRLFEYLATGRPIVAINPTAEDRRLLEAHWGQLLHQPTADEVHDALRRAGEDPGPSPERLRRYRDCYRRDVQAGDVAQILAGVGDRPRTP